MSLSVSTPFSADYEERLILKSADGESVAWRNARKVYRDGKGRKRDEFQLIVPQGLKDISVLIQATPPKVVVIDLATGRVLPREELSEQAPQASGRSQLIGHRQPEQGNPKRSMLGARTIEGVECQGQSLAYEDGVREFWWPLSLDLGQPILDRSLTQTEAFERRFFNIRIGEPDPALFAPLDLSQ